MRGIDKVNIKLEVTLDGIPYQINEDARNSINYLIMESLK